jgi:tetratricopeptide (TPR) repeat protein
MQRKSAQMHEALGNAQGMGYALQNLAKALMSKGDIIEAAEVFRKAIKIAEKWQLPWLANAQTNLVSLEAQLLNPNKLIEDR